MEQENENNGGSMNATAAKIKLFYNERTFDQESLGAVVKHGITEQEQKKEENPEQMKENDKMSDKEEEMDESFSQEEDISETINSAEQLNGDSTSESDTAATLNVNIREDNIETLDNRASTSSENASGSSSEFYMPLPDLRVTDTDIEAVYLTRNMLEKLIQLPTFNELVVGCVVKILGPRPDKYKVADILGVNETSDTYSLGSVETNLGLLVRHGTKQATFRMEYLSNQDVTRIEIVIWGLAANEASIAISRKPALMQKARDIKAALTEFEQLSKTGKLNIPEDIQPSCSSSLNIAKQKTVLIQKRSEALGNCDIELVDAIDEDIGLLDEQSAKQHELRTEKLKPINMVNFRNRQINSDTVPKDVPNDKDTYEAGPCIRKPTNPSMKFTKSKGNIEKKSPDTPTKEPSNKKLKVNPGGAELYALHNFDVNVDIDSTSLPVLEMNVSP